MQLQSQEQMPTERKLQNQKCVVSTSMKPDKVYLGTTKGDFKQRFYNHKKPFSDSTYRFFIHTLYIFLYIYMYIYLIKRPIVGKN